MQLIKAIVRPDKVDDVKDALTGLHVSGMTVSEVRGPANRRAHRDLPREGVVTLLPKMQVETVVPRWIVDGCRRLSAPREQRDRRRPGLRHAGHEELQDRTGRNGVRVPRWMS
jgi:hypothetical protein